MDFVSNRASRVERQRLPSHARDWGEHSASILDRKLADERGVVSFAASPDLFRRPREVMMLGPVFGIEDKLPQTALEQAGFLVRADIDSETPRLMAAVAQPAHAHEPKIFGNEL